MTKKILILTTLTIFLTLLSAAWAEASADFIFSNKDYERNLPVQAVLASNSQVIELIQDATFNELNQKTYEEIGKDSYIFVRVRNTANEAAWGTLSITIDKRKPVKIEIPFIGANHLRWCHFIIYDGGINGKNSNKPEVKVRWQRLYTK